MLYSGPMRIGRPRPVSDSARRRSCNTTRCQPTTAPLPERLLKAYVKVNRPWIVGFGCRRRTFGSLLGIGMEFDAEFVPWLALDQDDFLDLAKLVVWPLRATQPSEQRHCQPDPKTTTHDQGHSLSSHRSAKSMIQGKAQKSLGMTSPWLRVDRAVSVSRGMLSRMNRTEPSPITKLAPPV